MPIKTVSVVEVSCDACQEKLGDGSSQIRFKDSEVDGVDETVVICEKCIRNLSTLRLVYILCTTSRTAEWEIFIMNPSAFLTSELGL